METLAVELPTTHDDWAGFASADLDAKLVELDVVQRRVEAAIVGATDQAERELDREPALV
jgi:hypothetical protein